MVPSSVKLLKMPMVVLLHGFCFTFNNYLGKDIA